jgi:hypothetical protein
VRVDGNPVGPGIVRVACEVGRDERAGVEYHLEGADQIAAHVEGGQCRRPMLVRCHEQPAAAKNADFLEVALHAAAGSYRCLCMERGVSQQFFARAGIHEHSEHIPLCRYHRRISEPMSAGRDGQDHQLRRANEPGAAAARREQPATRLVCGQSRVGCDRNVR